MFERMDISESLYEGVLETAYEKPTQAEANRSGNRSNKRGKPASSKTRHAMANSADKHQK